MHVDAHGGDVLVHLRGAQVHFGEEPVGDAGERLLGPLHEPVDGTAVDQRRELAASGTERLAHRGHAQDDVEVIPDPVDERAEEHILRGVQAEGLGVGTNLGHHSLLLVLGEQPGNLAAVEDVVDVLDETLGDDLRIREQKHGGRSLDTRLHVEVLEIVAELGDAVPARELDAEALEPRHETPEPRQRLLTRAAHADEHGVTSRLPKDPGDSRGVLGGVHEEHQVHLVRGAEVVLLEVVLHDLDHLGDVVALLVHPLLGLAVLVQKVAKDDVAIFEQVRVRPGAELVLDRVTFLVELGLWGCLALGNRRILVPALEHDAEVLLHELGCHHLVVVLVLDADEPVVKHPHGLVHPEPGHDVQRLALVRGDEQHALEHLAQVAEVEGVVALLRRG